MKITNRYDLPLNLDKFQFKKPNEKTLSVTRLVDSPQIPYLTALNWDNLELDVSDMLHQLEGQGMHAVLEGHVPDNALAEEDMSLMVDGVELTARADQYHEDPTTQKGTITDWKTTSVMTVIKATKKTGNPVKDDWIKKLNVYGFMFRKMGYDVEKLKVWIWMRDHTPSAKMRSGPEYPPCKLMGYDVKLWTMADAEAYVSTRIATHKVARATGNYSCSNEDRWMSPETYAVMKPGRKTALAVFGDDTTRGGGVADAEQYLADQNDTSLVMVVRRGGFRRCEAYCPVRSVCPQWARDKPVDPAGGTQ